MNAPFALSGDAVRTQRLRQADLRQPDEVKRIEGFVAERGGCIFQRPAWLTAIEQGTGQRAHGLVAERDGKLTGWLPLTQVHSPIFGRMLASSGFAVGGGVLAADAGSAQGLCTAAQELAQRLACPTVELRGGPAGEGWAIRSDSHCGFVADLADDAGEQLKAIPRKQRAEVRKGQGSDLAITIGKAGQDRDAHYAVYAQSVRNLGTPVFPRGLFTAVLANLNAEILTVWDADTPIASVLSLYHDGVVMPYWGGGTHLARRLRANDRMYFELMLHARSRGCTRFDFGRSKTGSGAYTFKKNWGFKPQPLTYATWTAPGHEPRDADPTSARHQSRIAAWKRLPLPLADRLGPLIARGLG